jgi:sorbose reductase
VNAICTHSLPVSDSTQVSQTMEKVVEDFGKIDVFVANAGK